MIGSPNYGYRSYYRDTELNFYIYSQDAKFKEKLHFENLSQFANSQDVSKQNLRKDKDMKFGFFTMLFSKLLSGFL